MAVSAVVEQVFNTILDQLSEEIGALLGAPIELTDHCLEVLNKDSLFAISRGRSVLSTMVVSGDKSGDSFIITDLKDSVILGGTLIMLPQEQIEENCKLRTFDGEAADAYGEVANIISGVYTAVFLDMYPDNLHFKRTSVDDFVPSQIDPNSDTPFPPNEYVYSCCSMKIEGFDLNKLEVIIPASILGEETKTEPVAAPVNEAPPVHQEEPVPDSTPEEVVANDDAIETPPQEPEEDRVEQEVVNRVINAAMMQCAEEIGGMLGIELEIEGITGRYTSKKEFFAKPGKKTISTEMLVSGDSEGTAYFLTDLKDAIFFAGTMIMLPAEEIANHIKAGEYGEDEADAFGEVANIISGGLVQNFDEMYPRKVHLKKGEQELFTPTKVKVEDPTPFPAGEYYVVTGTLSCDARDLSEVSFICPVDLLHMVPRPVETGWGAPATDTDTPSPVEGKTTQTASVATDKVANKAAEQPLPPIVAVVCDDQSLRTHFSESISTTEHQTIELSSNENFNELRQYSLTGAFLIVEGMNEKGFAAIIKVRSELPQGSPLIVAGPQWTRSDVIKAVRYGATDIILTPATNDEICEKAKTNLKTTCH
ncbi:MAG: hypothetical protein BA874_09185 [Desulfuromonadales bacterium C00003068]|nr:MAG: hypothetical protein BA874_09185 [Desulfuromonadales bacterium C00003068]